MAKSAVQKSEVQNIWKTRLLLEIVDFSDRRG